MKVGFHAPLPPARTGVADYAESLLRELRKHGRVEVDAERADVHLYHLGNNSLHRDIYARALRNPGVAVLHDAVLNHFLLGSLDRAAYVEEFVYNYGEWERPLAEQLWLERAGSGMDARYFERPLLKRIADRSLAVIVHNEAAAAAVRAHAPEARVAEVPHLFDCPRLPSSDDRELQRVRWDLDETNYLFAVFGHLRESKRIMAILRAFEKLQQRLPSTRLLLAGEFASADLERAAAPWLDLPGVLRARYLPDNEFWRAAAAADCCLNLRSPTAGETSGIGVRLMGLGRPVFFTDGPEIARIPENACFRISAGVEEQAELFEYMYLAARYPDAARASGGNGRDHIRRRHAPAFAGREYWKVLCAACASPL